ncbi:MULTISPECIES: methionine gamma-lyase [unclassified Shewanella]|uniref:methionine gamma-lyase n=1 Tax=unclassified Shewanella TaxID=196818 RepID=UPI000C815A64|nr:MULTISPECIES: methionine gamma-lyase [unclassified Shewanella]MDO6620553.1 methionine gamma-lyase [Shewanella sp. 6_MG-2023]MDO6641486.1 methionine gamma-lyase [Shewanella sp. 5_MG-2023]MDO6680560.1 methionine gamma-lyase [Shewanella sp. 4_MG-2023]MDO6776709.1 methionine gamma-lyase [Shewanella sp. 3_MG-2023]PMH87394.1 methionine gamma-lyase [Shewanella sp. 10N.286.48.B5]
MPDQWKPATVAIHGGHIKEAFGALVTPLYQSATFVFDNAQQGGARFAGDEQGYIYTRLGNPTTAELERKMALLEGAESAAACASGMAAVSAALMTHLEAGDHLISSNAVYGCTFALLSSQLKRYGVDTTFVDFSDPLAIEAAIQPNTKLVFCESPVNPHLQVFDLTAIAAIAKRNNLISIVDNTFMTPLLQQPLTLGIDMVIHSATKYLNGHGDVIAGIVCGSEAHIHQLKYQILKDFGGVISPHDAWLILRGLKTLDVRLSRHCDNAEKLAVYLNQHTKVSSVFYPGLENHQGFKYVGKQMRRAGGVIAFELIGSEQDAINFVNKLKLFTIAVSLGDAESLIQHPASMTHSPYTPEARAEAGITDNLLRISVGLENVEDLIIDIEQAL